MALHARKSLKFKGFFLRFNTTDIARAFTPLAPEAEPILSMRYAARGKAAWRRDVGRGRVYAYYGPMDLRQREDSWVVSYNLPFRFLKDGIEDARRDGKLAKVPVSLNFDVQDVNLVETEDGLRALNMGDEAKKVIYPGGLLEIPARSLIKIQKPTEPHVKLQDRIATLQVVLETFWSRDL